ncbi:MAG: hypothetical protein GEV11_21305 [Streptosporangiales bacterium]|nr:hypothetical protein [Streptosporangiales bacterium]
MRRGAPYGLGLVLGMLALGPALAPGFTLAYDMVFVPDPPITATTFGLTGTLPRAVPSDAVVALLSTVLPADLVQKALLLGIFVLACAGAAALVPTPVLGARLAAGAFYAWNPFVAERLLIGQWAFLLGYAGLPWAVRAAARLHRRGGVAALVRALIPAAIGGFTPMIVTALTVACVAICTPPRSPSSSPSPLRAPPPSPPPPPSPAPHRRRSPFLVRQREDRTVPARSGGLRRAVAGVVALGTCGVLALPWLVASLWRPDGVAVDPAGVAAFAARADTPFGGVGSLFLLGGIWNAEAVPRGYGDLAVSTLRLLLATTAVIAYALLTRSGTRLSGGSTHSAECEMRSIGEGARLTRDGRRLAEGAPHPVECGGWVAGGGASRGEVGVSRRERWTPRGGLALAAGVGLGIACLGLVEPGREVLRALSGVWAGFAVLRDAQQYVAPFALLQAVGFGLLLTWAIRPRPLAHRSEPSDSRPSADRARVERAGARAGVAGDEAGAGSRRRAVDAGAGVDRAGWMFGVFGVVAPVVLVPSLVWGVGGRLGAVDYPQEWMRVREVIAADRTPGAVLALPWSAHRRYRWSAERTLLDPMPRFLPRRVVAEDAVQVGNVRLAAEDPRARAIPALLGGDGDGDLTEPLRRAGFRYVIVDAGGPKTQNVFHRRLGQATRIHDGPELTAYRLVTPAPYTEKGPPAWAVGTAFSAAFMAILWSLAISGSSLLPRSRVLREESL